MQAKFTNEQLFWVSQPAGKIFVLKIVLKHHCFLLATQLLSAETCGKQSHITSVSFKALLPLTSNVNM